MSGVLGLGGRERRAVDFLHGRGAQAPDRRGVPGDLRGRPGSVHDLGGDSAGERVEGAPLGTRAITRLEKKRKYVYHYNFHIIDRAFRRPTVKMSRRPAFGAQVILHDHEHVAVAAQSERIGFTKEENYSPPRPARPRARQERPGRRKPGPAAASSSRRPGPRSSCAAPTFIPGQDELAVLAQDDRLRSYGSCRPCVMHVEPGRRAQDRMPFAAQHSGLRLALAGPRRYPVGPGLPPAALVFLGSG